MSPHAPEPAGSAPGSAAAAGSAETAGSDRVARFTRLAAERPDDPDALMFHGNALVEAGHAGEAVNVYAAALTLRPLHAPTLYNLGNAHLVLGDAEAAAARYAAALDIDPSHVGGHNNHGNALRRLGRPVEAAACYRAALALRPDLHGARTNLAVVLLALHRPEEAEAELRAVLAQAPDDAEARNALGGALLALDRPEEALVWFRGAIARQPNLVQARFGEAMALLTMGALRDGFAAYEARWLDPRFREDLREYAAPLWLGDAPLGGVTILVHHEQGLGDTIQFARYLGLLRARGARVVLEVQAPLLRLLAPLADAAVAAGAALPPHDLRVPMLSLPLAFGTTLANVPAAVPYLHTEAPAWRARGPGLNVALTCRGNPEHPDDRLRSISPAVLGPLRELQATLHVVHKDDPRGEDAWFADLPGVRMHGSVQGSVKAGAGLTDFAATASLLAAMDLVVSVDTAVAHLAGALARPVWILLQHSADFRWLREREDSPWYPTAKLFRQSGQQTADRAWEEVIARVAAALVDVSCGNHFTKR